jgi:hypothetical protein
MASWHSDSDYHPAGAFRSINLNRSIRHAHSGCCKQPEFACARRAELDPFLDEINLHAEQAKAA